MCVFIRLSWAVIMVLVYFILMTPFNAIKMMRCSWRYSLKLYGTNKYSIRVNLTIFGVFFFCLNFMWLLSWSHRIKLSMIFIRFQWANWKLWWMNSFTIIIQQYGAVKLFQHKLQIILLNWISNRFVCSVVSSDPFHFIVNFIIASGVLSFSHFFFVKIFISIKCIKITLTDRLTSCQSNEMNWTIAHKIKINI